MRVTRVDASVAEAVAYYHELCRDPALAGPAIVAEFIRAQKSAGLTFGGAVQCRTLRPAFITTAQLASLRAAVDTLWRAFARIETRAIDDAVLAARLGLSPAERELIAIDPGYADATVVSRLDLFFEDQPLVLEYNADSPAGMHYQAGQMELMSRLPVFERFCERFALDALHADIALRETLIEVWREFAHRRGLAARNGSLPRVAILDLAGAATSTEFQLVARDLERHGMPAIIATPEDLSYEGGRLRAGSFEIDLVYKRLLVADFLARYDVRHPLIEAYRAGSTCVASSFRCAIAHKKRALALVWDQDATQWFAADELHELRTLIPSTRPLDVERAIVERESLVLKPNDAHGGEGVAIGAETPPQEWERLVRSRASSDDVLQLRVPPQYETYPVFSTDEREPSINFQTLIQDRGAYLFRGRLGGILTRLSASPVVNVSQGGQAIPTYILSDATAA